MSVLVCLMNAKCRKASSRSAKAQSDRISTWYMMHQGSGSSCFGKCHCMICCLYNGCFIRTAKTQGQLRHHPLGKSCSVLAPSFTKFIFSAAINLSVTTFRLNFCIAKQRVEIPPASFPTCPVLDRLRHHSQSTGRWCPGTVHS